MTVVEEPEVRSGREDEGGCPSASYGAFGSTVKLFDRMDGTYLHPAPSATAEHCVNFWANVAIPDEIITQVENAYYNDRQQEISDDVEPPCTTGRSSG